MTARTGWWRGNRFWLAALPVALLAAVAASSYNVKPFWYENGLHHEVASAPLGSSTRATIQYDDALGATSRTFEVSLAALQPTDSYPYRFDEPGPPPDGVDAISVHLHWKAEPDQVLRSCTVSLVDDQGRRYDAEQFAFSGCVPEARGGPTDPQADGERGDVPEGEDRPPSWTTAPVVLVPQGREITQVLVWWERPSYVTLSAS